MNKDMERWIEAAARAKHSAYLDRMPEHDRQSRIDQIANDFKLCLQAAEDDGVKLTPRRATMEMGDSTAHSEALFSDTVWQRMHDAAPNYLDDDA